LTPFGRVLVIATVVVGAVVAFTGWMPAVLALVVLIGTWLGIYRATDPVSRMASGDNPARDAEQRWNLD
jgi:disulfide bond formation protein DsbB